MTGSHASFIEKVAYKLRLKRVSAWLHDKRVSRLVASVSSRLVATVSYGFSEYDSNPVKDLVFIFWLQGEAVMPPAVRACFESVKKQCDEKRVVLIDNNNLTDWVTLPSSVFSKLNDGELSITHFSDIVRFSLLEKYGGWWLDATVFLSNKLPSVEGLFSVRSLPNNTFVSKGRWTGFIWHMSKGSPFAVYMRQFLLFWWSQPDATLPDYFLMDYCIRWYYRNNRSFRKQIDALPVSNPDLYFFQSPHCETPYSEKEWQRISTRTTFFKTSHKLTHPPVPGSFRATILEHNNA